MPGIYKLFTAVVAVIGNVSLISSGEINPIFSFLGFGLLFGYYRSLKKKPQLSKRIVGRLALLTFIAFVLDLLRSGDIFIAVAQMTLVFQTIKSFDLKDPWDPPQVFFMSLLQLLIASELTHSFALGFVFVLFIVFIVVAVILGHLVKEGQNIFRFYWRSIVVITIITITLSAMVFVFLPRLRSGLWGKSLTKGIRTTGFDEKVDFGSYEEIKKDETVVIRMIPNPDIRGPHYLRGMTFDYFDGTAWYDSIKDFKKIYRTSSDYIREAPRGVKVYEAEILLEPIASDVIFTFKKPFAFRSEGFWMRRDAAGSFFMRQKSSKRFNYTLLSYDGYYNDNEYLQYYLQFPEGIPSVHTLAGQIVSGAKSEIEKAERIRKYLLDNYSYSLSTERPPPGMTPIEYFLSGSRKGYCEHFATAMVLLLRSSGIPARLVTGFFGGEKNEYGGYYLLRQSSAHSWVEAYIHDRWMPFDPTPPVESKKDFALMLFFDMIRLNWNRYVVGFSNYDQDRILAFFRGFTLPGFRVPSSVLWTGLLLALLFTVFLIYRIVGTKLYPLKKHGRISSEYLKFRKKVAGAGGEVGDSSTSEEVLNEALESGKFAADEVRSFIDLYRALRFSKKGGKPLMETFYHLSGKLMRK